MPWLFITSAALSAAGFALYGQILLQSIILALAAKRHNFQIKRGNFIIFFAMSWIFYQGLLIGGVRTVLGFNLFGDFIQYSLLWALAIFAFCIGSTYAQRESKYETNKLFAKIFVVELASVFARIDVGFFTRSSVGFSFFLPFWEQSILRGKNFTWRSGFSLTVTFFMFLYVIFFSGLRSVFVLGLVVFGISFFHFSKYAAFGLTYTSGRGSGLIRFFYILAVIILATALYQSYEYWSYFFDIVRRRFAATIFNTESFQLDPAEGRSEEADKALAMFEQTGHALKEIFGLGFGFVFFESTNWKAGWVAHIHITPVAYFVRFGMVGVFFWCSLFLVPVVRWRVLRKAKVELWVFIVYYLFLSSSMFAGFLNVPAFWLLLGYMASIQCVKHKSLI